MSYEKEFPIITSIKMTSDEIIKFADQYDPQSFHTDPELAKDSIYGGLIASGLHCIHKIWSVSPIDRKRYELIAGLGFTVKFYKPIYADIEYMCEQTILDKREYRKLSNSYIYKTTSIIKNNNDEILFKLDSSEIVRENISQ